MTNNTTQEIKDRLNIVDVLSSYIQLKKSGANYKAVCPFHHEKTPSLMVSPAKQVWHCFGCGEGGDIFGFVMKYENVEFAEALKLLAEKAGVTLPKYGKQEMESDKRKGLLYRINELTAKFYHQVLLQSQSAEQARLYLKNRGLNSKTISDWQIGYASSDSHALEQFLAKKGFEQKDLLEAGVIAKSSRGETYDRFFGRITFPISDYSGNIVGFTARVLDAEAKTAKYINSPETLIYSKSRIIFGLYQAKQAIRRNDFALVVEGNMDVITAHQAGFENAVASSGTAFTFDQLKMLSRLTKNLKFAFDTDNAGAAATLRALDSALALGFTVSIVRISGAKDPDEMIKKNIEKFSEAVKESPLYLEYFFEKSFENFNPNSVEDKKKVIAVLIPLLKKLSDPLESAHYTRVLAQRLNVPEKTIYDLLAKEKNSTGSVINSEKKDAVTPMLKPKSYILEQKLLGYALFDLKYKEILEASGVPELFGPEISGIFFQLRSYLKAHSDFNPDSFIQHLLDQSQGDTLDPVAAHSELAKMSLFMVESEYHNADIPGVFEKEFQSTLKEYLNLNVKLRMQSLVQDIAAAEQTKDKSKLDQLKTQFSELSKKLTDF